MESFIKECVDFLYKEYGKSVSELNILLPTRRAKLFFNTEFAGIFNGEPVWEPKYLSIDSLMERISGISSGERLTLLITLHRVYSKFHTTTFDEFYYWGEMLISDFDAIDNYMIDPKILFKNSKELKEIDMLFDDIAKEQREVINRFWSSFSASEHSKEQKEFLKVWNTLYDIYTEYKQTLISSGIGYKGMIYREAAERLKKDPSLISTNDKFVIIGFNALSSSEKLLFNAIKSAGNAIFLWDWDNYYTKSNDQEAGLFIRENLKDYPEPISFNRDGFISQKQITVSDYPTDAMQCKGVSEFLEACIERAKAKGKTIGRETAIVLTDESLLLPVLYSIPKEVSHFNVTGGYPLKLTAAFTLFKLLINLQRHKKTSDSETLFYYKEVHSLISHSYIKASLKDDYERVITLYKSEIDLGNSFINLNPLYDIELIKILFSTQSSSQDIGDYLISCIEEISKNISSLEHNRIETEFLYQIGEAITQLNHTLKKSVQNISTNTYIASLEKHLKSITTPFEGEPLVGVQIMGILETRNLDFENLLILSVNEDTFPSSYIQPSYIPQNLRQGYGLPTLQYREAMYAYYFYRLIQRAKYIDISYCSANDGLKSGEASRFIAQLRYSNTHPILFRTISIKINATESKNNSFQKDHLFDQELKRFIAKERSLSPSALFDYIQCPAKFYFSRILKIKKAEEVEKELDPLNFGNVIHFAAERIYKPLIGIEHNKMKELLSRYLNDDLLDKIATEAISEILKQTEIDGDIVSKKEFIKTYLSNIIKYDLSRNDHFIIENIEKEIVSEISIEIDSEEKQIKLYGKADRIDLTKNDLRVITDYKTGKDTLSASTIESLFDGENKIPNKPFMQSLTYCFMYNSSLKQAVYPSLYFVSKMNRKNYSHKLILGSKHGKFAIDNYDLVKEEFELALKATIEELFNKEIPFKKTLNKKSCDYCDYKEIC